jgi:dsDNA-specific endonuclease/ATPase MutS2
VDEFDEPFHVPISDTFDLHPFAPRDVRAAVEGYLEEVHRLRLTGVRIIHGRGIGFQRQVVREVLAATPFVLWFGDAPPEAGGWGATIARLSSSTGG